MRTAIAVRLGHVVGGDRVGEHVRAVAHRGHDEPLGVGELDAERARQAPAEPARVRFLPPRVVLGETEVVERRAELGDHGRPPAADRGHRSRPRPRPWSSRRRHRSTRRDRGASGRCGRRSRARRSLTPTVGSPASRIAAAKRHEARPGLGRDRHVGAEVAHREPAVERVRARAGPPGSRRASWCTSGIHGARLSITSTTSASASHGPGSWPTYIGCSAEIAVATAHHWHTGIDHALGDLGERREPGLRAGAALGDDQRTFGVREQPRPRAAGRRDSGRASPAPSPAARPAPPPGTARTAPRAAGSGTPVPSGVLVAIA